MDIDDTTQFDDDHKPDAEARDGSPVPLHPLVGRNFSTLENLREKHRAAHKWAVEACRGREKNKAINFTEDIFETGMSWNAAHALANELNAQSKAADPKASSWTMDFFHVVMANDKLKFSSPRE